MTDIYLTKTYFFYKPFFVWPFSSQLEPNLHLCARNLWLEATCRFSNRMVVTVCLLQSPLYQAGVLRVPFQGIASQRCPVTSPCSVNLAKATLFLSLATVTSKRMTDELFLGYIRITPFAILLINSHELTSCIHYMQYVVVPTYDCQELLSSANDST